MKTNADVVRKLIGSIQPAGDTNIDDERLENLKAMCELVDNLIAEINDVAFRNKNRSEYSVKKMADYASEFLISLKDVE